MYCNQTTCSVINVLLMQWFTHKPLTVKVNHVGLVSVRLTMLVTNL